MMRTFRLMMVICSLALLGSCSEKRGTSGYNPPVRADQCVIFYMPGRSLSTFYEQNLEGISRAVSATVPGNGRMLVCWQPVNSSTARLQEIYYDTQKQHCETRTLKEYDSFAAQNPDDVAMLLSDAVATAPADRYGLIIGCHGKAWVPRTEGTLSKYSEEFLPAESGEDLWTPAPGALPTRSFGDPGHELEIGELAGVLEGLSARFDYLIFDACFMASIETLYDLRQTVDYVVASPCEIMAAGFPYDRITPRLFDGEEPRKALETVCREFWEFYENDWNTIAGNMQSGCISLAVMSELDALATAMRQVKQGAQQEVDIRTLQTYEGFDNHLFFDLGQYVEKSCADQELVDAFRTQFDRAFPAACRLNTGQFYSAYNGVLNPVTYYSGVTVSEPSQNSKAPKNTETAWYRATH